MKVTLSGKSIDIVPTLKESDKSQAAISQYQNIEDEKK
jgi:hypothetical protein